jgi:carboxylesterase type B
VGTGQKIGQASTGGVTNGEDCLYISVTKPSTASSTSKLPVLFYFSGGGYAQLSNINYNFDDFVNQSGGQVIVVQFGYVKHPGTA